MVVFLSGPPNESDGTRPSPVDAEKVEGREAAPVHVPGRERVSSSGGDGVFNVSGRTHFRLRRVASGVFNVLRCGVCGLRSGS